MRLAGEARIGVSRRRKGFSGGGIGLWLVVSSSQARDFGGT